jgi:hypothetical protein
VDRHPPDSLLCLAALTLHEPQLSVLTFESVSAGGTVTAHGKEKITSRPKSGTAGLDEVLPIQQRWLRLNADHGFAVMNLSP